MFHLTYDSFCVTAYNSRPAWLQPLLFSSLLSFSLSGVWSVECWQVQPLCNQLIVHTSSREWLMWLSVTFLYLRWSSPTPHHRIIESCTSDSTLHLTPNFQSPKIICVSLFHCSAVPCLHLQTPLLLWSSSALFSSATDWILSLHTLHKHLPTACRLPTHQQPSTSSSSPFPYLSTKFPAVSPELSFFSVITLP